MIMHRNYLLTVAVLLVMACSNGNNNDRSSSNDAITPEVAPLENPYAGFVSDTYDGADNWLCHDELTAADNACLDGVKNLDSTAVSADGSTEIEAFDPADEPLFDCFYVYPTVSLDDAVNSDLEVTLEEPVIASIQAARYSTHCRVYAPIYRQVTLGAIDPGGAVEEFLDNEAGELAYGDVLDAFKHFIASRGDDRGYILIGHSQGAAHLLRLLQTEIEPDEYLLDRLVAAHLLGYSVQVPEGSDVGGDLGVIPLCRSTTETGCVVTFSSYRQGDPATADGSATFGRPTGDTFAACVNPAALSGGEAELDTYFAVTTIPVFDALVVPRASGPYADPEAFPPLETDFYHLPGLVSGECRQTADGISFLEVTINADPDDPRADDIIGETVIAPTWGMHVVDFNLVMGDLVALAASQGQSWLSDR